MIVARASRHALASPGRQADRPDRALPRAIVKVAKSRLLGLEITPGGGATPPGGVSTHLVTHVDLTGVVTGGPNQRV